MKINRIHHLTLAVRDADAARLTFEALFGVAGLGLGAVPAFGVRTAGVPLGDGLLQLASPASTDNPVMRFLERKGEGFYSVALEVDDIDACVAELVAKGVRVSEPVQAEPGLRSAFITMSATHGLSIQLVEVVRSATDQDAPTRDDSLPPEAESAGAPESWAPPPAAEEPPTADAAAEKPPLDLTPDEWSDVD